MSGEPMEVCGSAALRWNGSTSTRSPMGTSARRGSLLSLKAYYRKLRTFKGTVQTLINLRRTPLLKFKAVAARAGATGPRGSVDETQRVTSTVPRISNAATTLEAVQNQVQSLVAGGHVVTEIDPASPRQVAYRQQGNLDHYTSDNLAKRVSLQQHPHMIALTQRLWTCALRHGERNLSFTSYETYMLCLHRLILPEFDVAASRELIAEDWARDSAGKDHLDYSFFHLSMFELVDLWTDTVDAEDYISLLYCIVHSLTFPWNDRHILKSLEDVRPVDVIEESKGMAQQDIQQDLEREVASESFDYYRDQVQFATTTTDDGIGEDELRDPGAPTSPRRDSKAENTEGSPRARAHQSGVGHVNARPHDNGSITVGKSSMAGDDSTLGQGRDRAGSTSSSIPPYSHLSPQKHKFSIVSRTNAIGTGSDDTAEDVANRRKSLGPTPLRVKNYSGNGENSSASPRRDGDQQRVESPNVFARSGGVILSTGTGDGPVISKSVADGKQSAAVAAASSAFPRRRSRSASNASQQLRRELLLAADKASKQDTSRDVASQALMRQSPLQVSHLDTPGSVLRTIGPGGGTQGQILPSGYDAVARPMRPFTIRAAAVAAAAMTMATSMSTATKRPPNSPQRPGHQQVDSGHLTPTKSTESPWTPLVGGKPPSTPREVASPLANTRHSPSKPVAPPDGVSGSALASLGVSSVFGTAGTTGSSRQGLLKPAQSTRRMSGGTHYGSRRSSNNAPPGTPLIATALGDVNSIAPVIMAISGTKPPSVVQQHAPVSPRRPSRGTPGGISGSGLAAVSLAAAGPGLRVAEPVSATPRYVVTNSASSHAPSSAVAVSPTSPSKPAKPRWQEAGQGVLADKAPPQGSPRHRQSVLGPAREPVAMQLQQQQQQRAREMQSLSIMPLGCSQSTTE